MLLFFLHLCFLILPLTALTIGLILMLVYSAYIFYSRRRIDLPTPNFTNFFQGHAGELRLGMRNLDTFLNWAEQCGLTYKFYVYHCVLVVSADHRWIKELLNTSKYPKSNFAYKQNLGKLLGKRMLGRGLVTNINHKEWLAHRTILNVSFTRQEVFNHLEYFNAYSVKLMKRIEMESEGVAIGGGNRIAGESKSFNIHKIFGNAALDIIAMTLFGIDLDALHDPNLPFIRCVDMFLKGQSEYYADPFIKLKPSKRKFVKEVLQHCAQLRQFGEQCILNRLEQEAGEQGSRDALSMILRAHMTSVSTHEEFEGAVDEFVTMFLAGHETTSSLMSFTLYLLAQQPAVYEKLMNEIDRVMTHSGRVAMDTETIAQLKYLDQVLLESLRMFPPGSGTLREVPEDTDMFGVRLPKGTMINLSFYVAHRWPEYFEQPHCFVPERWNDSQWRTPGTFVPFSSGARSCIGKHFAMTVVKVLLTDFLMNFEYQVSEERPFEIESVGTIRPKELYIRVKQRRSNNDNNNNWSSSIEDSRLMMN